MLLASGLIAGITRLLLGWVRCEIGQTPEEFEETMRKIAPAITHPISEDSKQRVMKSYQKSVNVPIYLRQAVKMLSKKLREHEQAGDIADGEVMRNRLEVARMRGEK